jgi:hypothetical protein
MTFLGFVVAIVLFCHYRNRLRHYRKRYDLEETFTTTCHPTRGRIPDWHREWHEKFDRKRRKREEREARRRRGGAAARRRGVG